MAEPGKERDHEIDRVEEYEEEQNDALSHSQLPSKSLVELNMLLVTLSLFSFSIDECMEYEEREHNVKHQVAAPKTCMSRPRLQTMNGNIHEPKFARRSSSSTRFQTTIRDIR